MVSGTRHKSAWAVVGLCLMLVWAVDYAGAWPIPDTGQTTSYAVGDDGYYSTNHPSFTKFGAKDVVLPDTAIIAEGEYQPRRAQ